MSKSCKSIYSNFLLTVSKNELAKDILRALIDSNSFFTFISTTFYIPTPILTPALNLLGRYTNLNLQKAIKWALKLFVKG